MRNSLLTLAFAAGWLIIQLSLMQHEYSSSHSSEDPADIQCEWCTQYSSSSEDVLTSDHLKFFTFLSSTYPPQDFQKNPAGNQILLNYAIRAPPKA